VAERSEERGEKAGCWLSCETWYAGCCSMGGECICCPGR
jgi:hypothetical protein